MSQQANELPAHLYLWDNRVLYAGPSLGARYRCYGSPALVTAVEGTLRVHRQTHPEELAETRCCLIRPGLPVYLDTDSRWLAVLFLDPFQHDLKILSRMARREAHGLLWSLSIEEQAVALARNVIREGPEPATVMAQLTRLGLSSRTRLEPEGIDPRVIRAVSMIRRGRTQNVTTEALATAVSLSVPRVIQLFRQHLGVSAGRYRQWHRLHATTLAIANGQTFTQAALAAGFADLAHFSNTFHSMLGTMPSRPLRSQEGICFHIDPDLARDGFSSLSDADSVSSPMC